jgi:hypothetical protein
MSIQKFISLYFFHHNHAAPFFQIARLRMSKDQAALTKTTLSLTSTPKSFSGSFWPTIPRNTVVYEIYEKGKAPHSVQILSWK